MVKKAGSGNTRPPGRIKKLQERSQKGRGAHDLLDNATLNQALEGMRISAFELIAKSTADEKQTREDAYYLIKVIDKFRKILEVYINQGDGANVELKKLLGEQNGG